MESQVGSQRRRLLNRLLLFAIGVVSLRVFGLLLWEYRWYFPADFDQSIFLGGRRFTFVGAYRGAFYVHVIAGPIALLSGVFLMVRRFCPQLFRDLRWAVAHRVIGQLQFIVVMLALVPSGIVMSQQAYGGTVSQLGFLSLCFLTGSAMVNTVWTAHSGQINRHQRWAMRCFLLLWSPLLLRLIGGLMITTGWESMQTYRVTAWASWLIPLFAYEIQRRVSVADPQQQQVPSAVPPEVLS